MQTRHPMPPKLCVSHRFPSGDSLSSRLQSQYYQLLSSSNSSHCCSSHHLKEQKPACSVHVASRAETARDTLRAPKLTPLRSAPHLLYMRGGGSSCVLALSNSECTRSASVRYTLTYQASFCYCLHLCTVLSSGKEDA